MDIKFIDLFAGIDTNYLAEKWSENLIKSYKDFYGVELQIPRWMDVKKYYSKRTKKSSE